jgi:hypothetical protein
MIFCRPNFVPLRWEGFCCRLRIRYSGPQDTSPLVLRTLRSPGHEWPLHLLIREPLLYTHGPVKLNLRNINLPEVTVDLSTVVTRVLSTRVSYDTVLNGRVQPRFEPLAKL